MGKLPAADAVGIHGQMAGSGGGAGHGLCCCCQQEQRRRWWGGRGVLFWWWWWCQWWQDGLKDACDAAQKLSGGAEKEREGAEEGREGQDDPLHAPGPLDEGVQTLSGAYYSCRSKQGFSCAQFISNFMSFFHLPGHSCGTQNYVRKGECANPQCRLYRG